MRIVYFSKGVRGVRCLSAILEADHEVITVVGVKPEEALLQLCKTHNLPLLFPEHPNTVEVADQLRGLSPDLFVLSGYNKILRPLIFEIPPLGTINLHGGKLPEYRGAAPINWQIIQGETTGGCAVIFLDEGIDTGDIIAQEIYPITAQDTHASVLEKTLEIFPELLIEVLTQIEEGSVEVVKQNPLEGCYYTRRYPRDSRIFWRKMSDIQVRNLVRGMHGPYPAAFSYRGEVKIEIDQTRLLPETITGTPGRVPMKRGSGVIILARNRGLLVEEITVDGNRRKPADFFRLGDDLR